MKSLFVFLNTCFFQWIHGRRTTMARIQSLPQPYYSNCLLHGMDFNSSLSRKHSHGIPMYLDARIYISLSIPDSFSEWMCGSCVLIRLLDDDQHIYLNGELTHEHKSKPHVSNQFLGIVIDLISISDVCIFNTYGTDIVNPSHYPIQIESHPCPLVFHEAQEFLFCTDLLCHPANNITFQEPSFFRDYYNPYYTTFHPRNVKYPVLSIQLFFYSHQRFYLTPNSDWTGFILPSTFLETHSIQNTFYVECTDSMNQLYQYQMTLDEIMHLSLSTSYHGGALLSKFPTNRDSIYFPS